MSLDVQRTRRRQLREETRRQILEAAVEFLRDRSYRELSVEALMARTGHTRTLFYHHFDGVPALMRALIQDVGGELVQVATEWSGTQSTSAEDARVPLARFVAFHTRNGPVVRAVVEAAHHDDAIEQAYAGMVEGFVAIAGETIQARIDMGELAPVDAPEIARALVVMVNGYLVDPRRSPDPDRAFEAIWTIWTRTLFPAG